MANKKKLSLQEFIQDQSFGGGNWADDDFDPSSISVPLMGQRPHDNFANHQQHFQPRRGPPQFNDYGGAMGPPFIVKISNIPAFFGNGEIEELFESRFMKFVKFKLFWEVDREALRLTPDSSDILNKKKKVAFVELHSHSEFDKVLKWYDVYLDNGLGKLRFDPADFEDFRTHADLNQRVSESEDPSLSISKRRPSNPRITQPVPHKSTNNHQPLREHPLPPLHPASPAPPPKKSNPFGNARPVDTLSKQLELEKKLHSLEINSTTYRTLGHLLDEPDSKSNSPKSTSPPKQAKKKNSSPPTPIPNAKAVLKPATQPMVSAWGNDISGQAASPPKSHPLGLQTDDTSASSTSFKKKSSGTEETGKKMVILKRKHVEPKKSRVASPKPEDEAGKEEKALPNKDLDKADGIKKLDPLKTGPKKERPKRERPARERPTKKNNSSPLDKPKADEVPNEQKVEKQPKKKQEKTKREDRKGKEKESVSKSSTTSSENLPEAKAPTKQPRSNPERKKETEAETNATQKPKSKKGRGGRGRGSNGTTRENSTSTEISTTEKPSTKKADTPAIEIIEASKPEKAPPAAKEGASRGRGRGGRGGRSRGRGHGHFGNISQTYNNKETKPSESN